ncbi:MAG: NAD-glutamate dehydrogenase, partial [Francisellaceae bacterium]|nr:NAD-glutamate dehydrogenase [Francisellaceae bacterium]
PNPDPLISYHERLRLFKLNGSSWQDYDSQAISSGGGVYSRSLKSITLTHEVKNWLNIPDDKLTPSALIKEIIKSKADLLFNGGIGTYVKAATESDINVGDKTNDILRVNANELQVKVIGEGGNLGLTQLARVEFAKKGGRINTDAIDNSAGVNCSDNEVNIKILLNEVVAQGELTLKQRDELLVEMTPEVVDLVLNNNRAQNEAISSVAFLAKENLTMHARLIEDLERSGKIDRNLEFLPNKSKIANRKASNLGLTRPEIAVLMAYTKNLLKKDLLDSNLPEEAFIYYLLEESFPKILSTRFGPYLKTHRLKREIIATRLSNIVINEMGISFIYRLADETGAQSVDIVQAYIIARGVFDLVNLKKTINDLNNIVDANLQLKMVQEVNRLMRRVTRWFIRNRQNDKSIAQTIECFKPLMDELKFLLPDILIGTQREQFNTVCKQLQTQNVPDNLAQQIASLNSLFSSLDIIEAALIHHFPFKNLAILYFSLGDRIQLSWLRAQIKAQPINNHWDALARAGFRDDLDRLQRILTVNIILSNKNPQENLIQMIEQWLVEHPLLNDRWSYFIKELKACEEPDFTMYSVVLRELFDLLRKGEDFF